MNPHEEAINFSFLTYDMTWHHGACLRPENFTRIRGPDPIRNRPDLFTLLGLVVKDQRVLDPTQPEPETRVGYPKTRNF